MADDKRPRARDVALEAGRRQREVAGETEAAQRQILASTLRLAGHMVSLNHGNPAKSAAPAQPDDAAQNENVSQPDGSLQPSDMAELSSAEQPDDSLLPDDASLPDPGPLSDDATLPDDTLQPDDTSQPDESPPSDDALQFDDPLHFDDAAQPGDTQDDESDPSGDLLLADSPAPPIDPESDLSAGDSTLDIEPEGRSIAVEWLGPRSGPKSFGTTDPPADGGGDKSGEPLVIHRFSSPIDSGLDPSAGDPNFYLEPANHGAAGDWLGQQPGPTSFGSPRVPAAGGAGSTTADDPLTGDTPPESPIVLLGDSAIGHRPPAPGTPPIYSSPGAASLSDPPSDGTGTGSGDGGGDSPHSGGRGAPGGGPAPAERPQIIVQPTAALTDRVTTAAAEKTLSLAQKTVDIAIGALRDELYVSQAARNALFPR